MIADRFFRSILDFVLPRECPACRTGYESDQTFCPDCQQELNRLASAARCDRCSMPVTFPGSPCAQCLGKGVSPIKQIASLGVMKEPLKAAIHRMKYERRWGLAERLAEQLFMQDEVRDLLENADVIVPVPLHRTKQRQRGYNQSEVIARRIVTLFNSPGRKARDRSASDANLPIDPRASAPGYQRILPYLWPLKLKVVNAAERIRATETQTHIHTRAQRIENLRNAFVLKNPSVVEGKNIVLLDDVLTTGATLVSLARVIKKAGPANISAIVLAVADAKGRAFEVI